MKLGIYARFMSQADQDSVADSQIGTLEAEINVVKAQLNRTLAAQRAYDECVAEGLVPTKHLVLIRMQLKTSEKSGDGEDGAPKSDYSEDKVLERPDFEALIDRWTSRIERLEKAHALLQGNLEVGADEDGDPIGTIRVKIIGGLPD